MRQRRVIAEQDPYLAFILGKTEKRNMAKKKLIKVNMEGVEAGRKVVPEQDYAIKVKEVTQETGEDSGKEYLAWTFAVSRGPHKGTALKPYNTSLQPQALWNLRGVLEAFGMEVPEGVMELDLEELNGIEAEAGCTVEHDTYNGRKQSNVVDVFHIDNLSADAGKAAGGGKGGKDSEVSEDDIMSMDEDELSALNDEHDLGVDLDDHKKLKAKRKAIVEAWNEKNADGGGDTDDLPDEDAVNEADEDDLEKMVKEHDLDVDLDDHKKLKDKRKAVLEAIEEKKEAGGGDGEKVTEDSINEMGKDELAAFVKEHKLDVELEGNTSKQRRAVIKAAKKADLIEE